jgi:hypothetical protein
MTFDPEQLDDDDTGFMSEWYQAIDDASARLADMGRPVTEAQPVLTAPEREKERETFLDKLRRYLLTSEGLDGIPEPQPLIKGVLYRDSLAWIVGRPGAGKSLVGLDWAGHIALGLDWCGFTTTGGPVVYVSPESPGGIRMRVRAWEASMGRRMDGVYFLPVAVQAATDGHWAALIKLCHEKAPAMIVLDTQARVTLGLEENSAKDMGVFVDKLERLRDATKACILVVHHSPRGGTHVRGSTAIEGAASTIITCVKTANDLVLGCDPEEGGKTKDVAPFDPVTLRITEELGSVVLSMVHDGGMTPNSSHSLTAAVRASLGRWWNEHGGMPVSASLLVRTEIMSEGTFYRIRNGLVREGLISMDTSGRWPLYALTRDPNE